MRPTCGLGPHCLVAVHSAHELASLALEPDFRAGFRDSLRRFKLPRARKPCLNSASWSQGELWQPYMCVRLIDTPRLLQLDIDVLIIICEELRPNRHLRPLASSCKYLRAIAAPVLFSGCSIKIARLVRYGELLPTCLWPIVRFVPVKHARCDRASVTTY